MINMNRQRAFDDNFNNNFILDMKSAKATVN